MTLPETAGFLDEVRALQGLIAHEGPDFLGRPTGFKGWTVERIVGHLHIWDRAAFLALTDEPAFAAYLDYMSREAAAHGLPAVEARELSSVPSEQLVYRWVDFASRLAGEADRQEPGRRVKWIGPELSLRWFVTGRYMETWAHAQAVYDLLGVERRNDDRIQGLAALGVNTFAWSFTVHGHAPPAERPYVRLTAPSGAVWEYGDPTAPGRVEGKAEQFCQVVTQCRNVADTDLRVIGQDAQTWMSMAQCFAGPPADPPAPGERTTAPRRKERLG